MMAAAGRCAAWALGLWVVTGLALPSVGAAKDSSDAGLGAAAEPITAAPAAGGRLISALPAVVHRMAEAVRPAPGCAQSFIAPGWTVAEAPVPLAPPMALTQADILAMRHQLEAGPFLKAGDAGTNSPAEVPRLLSNAASFLKDGEAGWSVNMVDSKRSVHGMLARDAAFMHLLRPNRDAVAKVEAYLTTEAASSLNDFPQFLCVRNGDGSVRDAWYGEANWLTRYLLTYDAVRRDLPAASRLKIENYIRRQAYFLAAQAEYWLETVFPARAKGDYSVRKGAAAPRTDAEKWATRLVDSNANCRLDADDDQTPVAVYAYARADGSVGPRLSVLSQWFNNRRSGSQLAVGLAGLLLGDAELTTRATRYFMEWLTYAVYPDGSEGEYLRNGNYCVPGQGVIYAAYNVQGAALLADQLARRGDRSLLDFSTRDGLFGTESAPGESAKSVAMVIGTHLDLARGLRAWYRHDSTLAKQRTTPDNLLGHFSVHVFGNVRLTDNFHLLGLLLVADRFPTLPIRGFLLRDPKVTSLPWPGADGHEVATGFGSWGGAWTDVFNAYPSALLLRAP